MIFEVVKVRTHSGFKADEYPTCFRFRGRSWEIEEVVDRWYEQPVGAKEIHYFKVQTRCGKKFILRHNLYSDVWGVLLT